MMDRVLIEILRGAPLAGIVVLVVLMSCLVESFGQQASGNGNGRAQGTETSVNSGPVLSTGKSPGEPRKASGRGSGAARNRAGTGHLLSRAVQGAESATRTEPLRLTLEESVKIALENNLQIRIASLTRDALVPEIDKAKAFFHPLLGLSFTSAADNPANDLESVSRSEVQTANAFISEQLPTGGLLTLSNNVVKDRTTNGDSSSQAAADVSISIVQPLMRGGRVYVATKPIKDAEYDVRTEEARLRATILKIAADTKRAYYNLNLAESVIDVIKEAIKRDEALIEASEALLKAGMVTIRDVISAKVSLAEDSSRLVSAQADAETAREFLLDVLGLPLGDGVEILDREITFEPIPMELDAWIATALKERPEIMAFEEQLAKSSLNVRVAGNSVLPQLDFAGSYAWTQTSSTVRRAFGLRGDAWSAGLVFSVPIGNVAAKSVLERAEIEHRRLQELLVQQERLIEQEVRSTEIKLRRSLKKIDALKTILEHSRNLYEVAKDRFARGLATNLDVTNAQEDIVNGERDLLGAIVEYNTGLAELEAAIARPLPAPPDKTTASPGRGGVLGVR